MVAACSELQTARSRAVVSHTRAALACLWWLCALGCDDAARSCRFGIDHIIFESASGEFDDVAVLQRGKSVVALFSDASGLYARTLDAQGLPRTRPARLAERCDAGLAAAVSGEALWLACARRARSAAEPGAVVLYELRDAAEERARFGPVGAQSHGVSVLAQQDGVGVAWQDAAMGGARVWYASTGQREPRSLSDPGWYASAPGLVERGGRLAALYAESQEKNHVFDSRVRLAEGPFAPGGGAIRTLAQSHDGTPSPDLLATSDGLWLAVRDKRKGRRKTGLYLSRLTTQGRPLGASVRVGRADGVGRPRLCACFGGLLVATPRTFAGDYFVGVVHVDRALKTPSLEQQFYEDSHEFAQVAAACLGDRMLLLIAERGRLGGESRAALRSVGFTCN